MNKNEIKELLINMRTSENEAAVNYLLGQLDMKSDKDLETIITRYHINEENISVSLATRIEKLQTQQEQSEHFTSVNKMFCFGRTGDTIHMHLIPKDLRGIKKQLGDDAFYQFYKSQLEDFLSRLQDIVRNDNTIKSLFAVSPIFFNESIALLHEELGFDRIIEIDLENKEDGMSIDQKEHFINMFGGTKKVYYTNMAREKLLEAEYARIPESEKSLLDD